MKKRPIQWYELIEDYFGNRFSDEEADRWWKEIQRMNVHPAVQNAEACAIIRSKAEQLRFELSYHGQRITLLQFKHWIKTDVAAFRREHKKTPILSKEKLLNYVKEKIRNASSPMEILNIISDSKTSVGAFRDTTLEEKQELEAWAEKEVFYRRPSYQELKATLQK